VDVSGEQWRRTQHTRQHPAAAARGAPVLGLVIFVVYVVIVFFALGTFATAVAVAVIFIITFDVPLVTAC
jgi:hypothetical protein